MKFFALTDAWGVFKAGQAVADPTAWKKRQVSVNQVGALLVALVALAKGMGYALPVDDQTLQGLAVGLFAVVNWLFTVVSTDKIGVMGGTPPAGSEPARDAAQLPARDAVAGYVAQPPASAIQWPPRVVEPQRSAPVVGPAGDPPARSAGPAAAPLGGLPTEPSASDPVRGWSASDLQAP